MPNSFSWKEPYLAALKESDKEKLTELVGAAEDAIFRRLQELSALSGHGSEREELKTASEGLLMLQVERLGWPSSVPRSQALNGPR